jgi:hypothetical protein
MTRTVFTSMTDLASHQLQEACDALAHPESADPSSGRRNRLAARTAQHGDLTAALTHLGRTIRGSAEARRDSATDRLLTALEDSARSRPWSEAPPSDDHVAARLREAARCIRAAADLWATHRTHSGRDRSPEASLMRHPSMQGAALRHWLALVDKSASVAAQLVRLACRADRDLVGDLRSYPRPSTPAGGLRPVPLPLARSGERAPVDVLDAIDDRVDRIHRHVWELAEGRRMSSTVLINAAAIGMLLARAALQAEQRSEEGIPARPSALSAFAGSRRAPVASVTQSDLECWAAVAATLAPVRTPDVAMSVLQIERLDLARLLERALARRGGPTDATSPDPLAERLTAASRSYRQVAGPCAASVEVLHAQGLIYLVGRLVPRDLITRHQSLVAARLGDRLVAAPAIVARRLEDQLNAISQAPPHEGSAA